MNNTVAEIAIVVLLAVLFSVLAHWLMRVNEHRKIMKDKGYLDTIYAQAEKGVHELGRRDAVRDTLYQKVLGVRSEELSDQGASQVIRYMKEFPAPDGDIEHYESILLKQYINGYRFELKEIQTRLSRRQQPQTTRRNVVLSAEAETHDDDRVREWEIDPQLQEDDDNRQMTYHYRSAAS